VFSRKRVMTMMRGRGRMRWLTADPSRRSSEMRRYAWEFVAFDDQEVGVPAPHNSALACARARLFALVCGPRPGRGPRSDLAASRVESGRMKMSGLTHREPTWKDTNASVRARGYNKSSACMCAKKLQDERRCVSGTRMRAHV